MNTVADKTLWIAADPSHIARLATWTDESEDGMRAHFSAAAVTEIRDHAAETRPRRQHKASGREAAILASFDTDKTRAAFAMAVQEMGGQIVPQMLLPSAASEAMVP